MINLAFGYGMDHINFYTTKLMLIKTIQINTQDQNSSL